MNIICLSFSSNSVGSNSTNNFSFNSSGSSGNSKEGGEAGSDSAGQVDILERNFASRGAGAGTKGARATVVATTRSNAARAAGAG